MADFANAEQYLADFKGDTYLHGLDILDGVGVIAARLGRRAALVADTFAGSEKTVAKIRASLQASRMALRPR